MPLVHVTLLPRAESSRQYLSTEVFSCVLVITQVFGLAGVVLLSMSGLAKSSTTVSMTMKSITP